MVIHIKFEKNILKNKNRIPFIQKIKFQRLLKKLGKSLIIAQQKKKVAIEAKIHDGNLPILPL